MAYPIATSLLACSATAYWQVSQQLDSTNEEERNKAAGCLDALDTCQLYGPRIAQMARARLKPVSYADAEVVAFKRPAARAAVLPIRHSARDNFNPWADGIDGLVP